MAGAGYKLFATGDVLTAAQVNTYLMQQTVMVFASSAARTSALSGVLAEGMVSYLQDTNTLEVYDGAAWIGATGDITALTAGTGISISSATGPVPTVTNSMATEITAKGDLIVGTGSGTFDNLPVAENGSTIVADSSTSTGLRYQGNFAAGKNKFINGDFGIWQRGTSFTTDNVYSADRWICRSNATFTASRQTFTPGTAPVAGYESSYFYRMDKSAGGSYLAVIQKIEDVRTFAGQTITVSFWAKANTSATITPYLAQDFGSGGSAGQIISNTSVNITSSWARYSVTATAPSISGKTIGTNSYVTFEFQYASSGALTLDVWGAQIEAGSVATPFQTATGTLQGELAACQRYFVRWGGSTIYEALANAQANSTTGVSIYPVMPVPMRIPPSSVASNAVAFYDTVTVFAVNTPVLNTNINGTKMCQIGFSGASGLTQFRYGTLIANNSTSAYLDLNAEL
jgi:hypothetical protein